MKEIYSSPHDELPLKNDKCAAGCTDLHLANRGITHLRGFEKFISLKTLWLNGNKLQSINGLDENVQLNSLHLHCNRIKRLEKNCFTQFKLLSRLTLNDNLLDDFDGTLLELKCMRNLLSLDLHNNPVVDEDNYRLRVLAAVPSLKIFDHRRVTDEEREEVKKFKEKMKKTNRCGLSLSSSSRSSRSRTGSEETPSIGTSKLVSVLAMLGAHAKEKRCSVEVSFQDIDRRNLGVIEVVSFWKVLRHYGLAQLLSDGEMEALILCYKKSVKVRAISATGTLSKEYINYRKFCWDILPVAFQDVKNSNAWKTDRAPEISSATQALRSGIRTVKKQRLLEETERKEHTLLRSEQTLLDSMKDPWHKTAHPHPGLDPWDGVELSRIISAVEAAATAAGGPETHTHTLLNMPSSAASEAFLLSREQCADIFYQASTLKKIPLLGTQRTLDLLFEQLAEGGGIYSHKFRAAVGCPQCPLKPAEPPTPTRIVAAAVKSRKQEVPVESKVAGAGAGPPQQGGRQRDSDVDRLTMAPLVKWRDMTAEEMRVLEDAVSQQSTKLFSTLLRAGSSEDVRALSSQSLQLGVIAARLGGQRVRETTPKLYYSPSEVTASATNRSDIVVLPNLKLSLSIKAGQPPSALSSPLSRSLSGSKMLKSALRFQKSLRISVGGDQTQSSSSCPESRTKGWAPGTSTLVIR